MNILIDPGHGGNIVDAPTNKIAKARRGAAFGRHEEHMLNLTFAHSVQTALKTVGHRVLMTRDRLTHVNDVPDLSERIRLINNEYYGKLNLIVSVHHNAAPKAYRGQWQGFETYYYDHSIVGLRIADKVTISVREVLEGCNVGVYPESRTGRRLAVLRNTIPPTILIEVGYMDHTEDLRRCTDRHMVALTAKAVAKGINDYTEVSDV